MQHDWPTKSKDMQVAARIIDEYIEETNASALGLFEFVINKKKEVADLRVSGWVVALAEYFQDEYGTQQGELVTKLVIGNCLTKGCTVH